VKSEIHLNACHQVRFWPSNSTEKNVCGRSSAPDPAGELTTQPRFHGHLGRRYPIPLLTPSASHLEAFNISSWRLRPNPKYRTPLFPSFCDNRQLQVTREIYAVCPLTKFDWSRLFTFISSLKWYKTDVDRKSRVTYRTAILSMTFNDNE